MANRTSLVNKDDPSYSEDDVDTGFLEINYSIGALWPALFEPGDMRYLDLDAGGQTLQVPYLVTTLPVARSNLDRRRPRLLRSLSTIGVEALDRLEVVLARQAKPYLVLDTLELWDMSPDGFDDFLIQSIRQADTGDLGPLLEQAGIANGEETNCYMGWETDLQP